MPVEAVVLGIALLAVMAFLLRRKAGAASRVSGSTAHARVSATAAAPRKKRASAALPVVEREGHTAVTATDALEDEATPSTEPPAALQALHVVTASELNEAQSERIQSICASMPEPHPVQRQLAGGLDTPEDLIEVVTSDAGLTGGVLRTVNSAAFSLASPISSVHQAITYMGVSLVKSLVAQVAVTERVQDGSPEQQMALARIWKSAGAASAVAQLLAQEMAVERPSVLATKALFFNLGDVALVLGVEEASAWYSPDVSLVDRVAAQQKSLGVNNALVGAALTRDWQLPDTIVTAIEAGLQPLTTPASELDLDLEERRSRALMYLAGRIGDRVAFGKLSDLGELGLGDDEHDDLFYVPEHLEAAGLGRVVPLMQDVTFRRKASRLLAAMQS